MRADTEDAMALQVELLRTSLDLVVEREPLFTRRFYEHLFTRYPQVRPLFSRNQPERQRRMLQEAIVAAVEHIEDPEWLAEQLGALGRKHVEYGVEPEMYDWVGECLILTLAEIAGDEWTHALERAWTDAYGALRELMLTGASKEARG